MAITNWVPAHKAAKDLDIPRKELNGMCNKSMFKLGKHYGACPSTRCRDTYYWNLPAVRAVLNKMASDATTAA